MLTLNTKLLGAALGALLISPPAPPAIPVPGLPAPVVAAATDPAAALAARVIAALEDHAQVDADQLAVSVEGTEVTLEGEVTSPQEAELAIQLAYSAGATRVYADFGGFDGGGASD